jgi:O-antigen/teichoic acid export membrane protein
MFLSILLFPTQLLSILGDEFTIGSTGLIILSIGTMIDAATGINVAMITMTGNTWLNTINSLAAVGVGLFLAITLIPSYGMVGATTAITLSLAILNTVRTIEVFVLFRLSPYNRSFIKPITAGAAGAAVAYLLSQTLFTGPSLINALINILFLMMTYVAVTFLLGLSPEDQAVLNRLQSRFSGLLKMIKK